MKFNHFAVESTAVVDAANRYIVSKQSFEQNDPKSAEKVSRAYLDLATGVGASSPVVTAGGKGSRIMVSKSRGTVMLSVPEGISLSQTAGLAPLSDDDFENLRDNARRALAAPAATQHPAPRGATH